MRPRRPAGCPAPRSSGHEMRADCGAAQSYSADSAPWRGAPAQPRAHRTQAASQRASPRTGPWAWGNVQQQLAAHVQGCARAPFIIVSQWRIPCCSRLRRPKGPEEPAAAGATEPSRCAGATEAFRWRSRRAPCVAIRRAASRVGHVAGGRAPCVSRSRGLRVGRHRSEASSFLVT